MMNFEQFKKVLGNGPKYRLEQIKQALFQDLIEDWAQATSLPLALRQKLKEKCPIEIKTKTFVSKDGKTIKTIIILADGLKIESVLMRHKDGRDTVCVSSQVGCPLDCSFCATGKMGLKRNLEEWEIVEQILFFARYLKREGKKITNIVFMGMGEPFLNYHKVLGAIKVLNDKEGFNLGARHFSISTVGITEGIKKLSQENLEVNLAVSLHAPNDKLRSEIMPIDKNYPIGEIFKAVDEYIKRTKRRVMIEYLMIKNINDSDESAQQLAKLVKKPLYFVNLISYSPTGVFEPSLPQRIKKFKEILERAGIVVTQRHRFGQDVEASCGQLASTEQ